MIPKMPAGFSHPMRIGEGAFASVYRVRQSALERWVALKFIHEKDPIGRRELLKEARTQAKLRADCVPKIYDAFEWRRNVWMVMEWIRGVSLEALLNTSLTLEDRLAIASGLVRALAAVHEEGFAHRDLKPANVIISPDRGLFLVDFGFSKSIDEMRVSSLKTAKGTPAYMAPELWSVGTQVDLMRADIYAAGKILVQILASTPYALKTASLIHEDPLQRPASGGELLALWEKENLFPHGDIDWKRIAGNSTSEQLSNNLFAAAGQLLVDGRSEEAYWLLVESLEENPDNRKTLELLNGFNRHPTRHRAAITYLLFGFILLAGAAAAFFTGARTGRIVVVQRTYSPHLQAIKVTTKAASAAPATATELRGDFSRNDKMSGRLQIRRLQPGMRVVIDGSEKVFDQAGQFSISLNYGEHTVTIRDKAGATVVNESVGLLPFQTKALDAVRYDSACVGD